MGKMTDWLLWPLPYGHVERHIRKAQGTWQTLQQNGLLRVDRDSPDYWRPYGLVRRRLLARLRENLQPERKDIPVVPTSGFGADGGVALNRIRAERDDSGVLCPDARVLVVLHLYYPDLWPLMRAYLENLAPYRWTLVITCADGGLPQSLTDEVRAFKPDVRFVPCPNVGFDVGPFVEALKGIDLGAHDVVFKIQAKGCRRPFLFMYDQVFKGSDWLFNLMDGTLGGTVVHRAIGRLMRNECALTAAENLIVGDPKHKRAFVEAFCRSRGLAYEADYRFVAGTCFAVRAEILEPLKGLGLGLGDFRPAVRGEFSLAHALERWMCFAAAGRMAGFPVRHDAYADEVREQRARSALRLLEDPRFDLDYEFFYRTLEARPIFGYEVVEIELGEIRRLWYDARVYPLSRCAPFRYLGGDGVGYDDYCRTNEDWTGYRMSRERFDALIGEMETFDERKMPVVVGRRNIIQDGQHRSSILLRRFGPHHRIKVLRIHDGTFE